MKITFPITKVWSDTYLTRGYTGFFTLILDLVKAFKLGLQKVLVLLTGNSFQEAGVAGDGCSILTWEHHGDSKQNLSHLFQSSHCMAVQKRLFPARRQKGTFLLPEGCFSLAGSAVGQEMSLLGFSGSPRRVLFRQA